MEKMKQGKTWKEKGAYRFESVGPLKTSDSAVSLFVRLLVVIHQRQAVLRDTSQQLADDVMLNGRMSHTVTRQFLLGFGLILHELEGKVGEEDHKGALVAHHTTVVAGGEDGEELVAEVFGVALLLALVGAHDHRELVLL